MASMSLCAFATNSWTASLIAQEGSELVVPVRDRRVERREALVRGQCPVGAVLEQDARDVVRAGERTRSERRDARERRGSNDVRVGAVRQELPSRLDVVRERRNVQRCEAVG